MDFNETLEKGKLWTTEVLIKLWKVRVSVDSPVTVKSENGVGKYVTAHCGQI